MPTPSTATSVFTNRAPPAATSTPPCTHRPRGEGERPIRLGRHVRRRRLIAGIGVRPDAAGAAQAHLGKAAAVTRRVATEGSQAREEIAAAGGAARAEQVRFGLERVPAGEGGADRAAGR